MELTEKRDCFALSLQDYLNKVVFADQVGSTVEATKEDIEGYAKFMENYRKGLAIERAAVENL